MVVEHDLTAWPRKLSKRLLVHSWFFYGCFGCAVLQEPIHPFEKLRWTCIIWKHPEQLLVFSPRHTLAAPWSPWWRIGPNFVFCIAIKRSGAESVSKWRFRRHSAPVILRVALRTLNRHVSSMRPHKYEHGATLRTPQDTLGVFGVHVWELLSRSTVQRWTVTLSAGARKRLQWTNNSGI